MSFIEQIYLAEFDYKGLSDLARKADGEYSYVRFSPPFFHIMLENVENQDAVSVALISKDNGDTFQVVEIELGTLRSKPFSFWKTLSKGSTLTMQQLKEYLQKHLPLN